MPQFYCYKFTICFEKYKAFCQRACTYIIYKYKIHHPSFMEQNEYTFKICYVNCTSINHNDCHFVLTSEG